jgi:O-antigen/teichoic acid export membrane protein
VLFAIAAICVLLIGGALTPFIAPGLERKLGDHGDVAPFMVLMLVNLALTLPLSVFPTILDGLQRFAAKSVTRLFFLVVRVGGIVYTMETAPGLWWLAVVVAATNLFEHAAMAILSFSFIPGLRVSWRLVDRATLREVKGYSVDAFLAMLAGRITVQTGAIVVGGFLTAASAAHYAVAARLVDMAKNLLRSATTTLTPAVSEREATGDFEGVRGVLLTATRWVLYLVLPIHLGMLFFGRAFLARWIGGPEYADWCFPTVVILSGTLTIGVAQSVASRILYGMGQLRLFARVALLEAGFNLVLCFALIGPYGLEGVAVAVAVPNVLFCLFVISYSCSVLEISLWRYLLASWVRPLATVGVPCLIWYFAPRVEATWRAIAIGIAMGLVPYLLVVGASEGALKWAANCRRIRKRRATLRITTPSVSH